MVHHHDDGTTEFEYFRPTAKSVSLVGDFNDWQPGGHPMTRDARGWWRLRASITGGEYRFRYLVNGTERETDFAAYGVEHQRGEGWNSVICVETANLRKVAAD